jgi:hypothetical protein
MPPPSTADSARKRIGAAQAKCNMDVLPFPEYEAGAVRLTASALRRLE